MPSLSDVLRRRVTEAIGRAVQEEGEAFAQALRVAAPYRTGALKGSIEWVQTGPASGAISLHAYGYYLSEGHAVARWGTSKRRNLVRHPYKTAGRTVPTQWIERAWAQRKIGLQTRILASIASRR
jgi:hypothetical protein